MVKTAVTITYILSFIFLTMLSCVILVLYLYTARVTTNSQLATTMTDLPEFPPPKQR
jgi:hypothetical protein